MILDEVVMCEAGLTRKEVKPLERERIILHWLQGISRGAAEHQLEFAQTVTRARKGASGGEH